MTPLPNIGWYPFWFWNDLLTEEEIRWQIAQMKSQGLRGFVLSPRQGLVQPYLSDSFFQMVAVAVQAAVEHGLVVHLYDELPYPSGPAGGEVLLGNPQFYATTLVQQKFDVTGGPLRLELPRGKILNAVAVPVRSAGLAWDRSIDLASAIGVVLTENDYQEVGLTSYNRKRYFANVGTPILQTTLPVGPHRIFVSAQVTVRGYKYYDQFIDVLNPAAVAEFIRLTHERYAARFPEYLGNVIQSIFTDETSPAWSQCVPAAFRDKKGYDLLSSLPALQDEDHPDHARVKADLHQVKYELFIEAFEKPIARWCREHKIAYWAEKPLLRLAQLQYSSVPGCDAGHVKAGAPLDMVSGELRANPRAAASAAYFYDKPAALCECYHSLGWGATLADLKRLADGLLLAGINCFVPHAFFYSTHNLRKHDAPPSMFFQMPYWKFFGEMVRDNEKTLAAFAGTHIAARVLVVDPTAGMPNAKDLAALVRLQHLLLEQHVDYLFVDLDTLQSQGHQIDRGMLRIKDLEIALVIIPPMRRIEDQLAIWLERFECSGGSVVRLNEAFDAEALRARLPGSLLEIVAQEGDARQVQLVTRQTHRQRGPENSIWFLHNTGATAVTLRLAGRHVRRLEPHESVLLDADALTRPAPVRPVKLTLPGQWWIHRMNENLLPLRHWRLTLTHDDGASQSAVVTPAPIMHQLERGKFRYAPMVQRWFGSIATLALPLLRLHYTIDFNNAYAGAVHLVMEPGSIAGKWTMRVNDRTVPAFAPVDLHVRGSLGVDITSLLHSGSNRIDVEVETERVDGGLLNCLYLAGDFGVQLNPLGLGNLPQAGEFGKWEANGLPFFAGVIEYHGQSEIGSLVESVELPLDPELLGDDAYEVSFNGGPWHAVLWSPRRIDLSPGELRVGMNEIRLRVYTTLLRAFEGQRFDMKAHRAVDV